uniref:Uncharacterized protein n=1 Tax=viral metagenome TaxID=1070528 RepID=A0A6C0DAH9_9ZZZZ
MDITNKLLKKYFILHQNGKNSFVNDKEKSYDYFKDSLLVLDELKKNHFDNIKKHRELLEESESDCYKYINLTIESSIETEYNKTKVYDNASLLKSIKCGSLDEIKSAKYGQIDFKECISNQTILHHAIKHGDTTFLKYAFKLGARVDLTNSEGYTLLEYACLEEDPNMIEFLGNYGADMKKHLYFRDGTIKYKNKNDSIDISILLKIILSYSNSIDDNYEKMNNQIYNKIKLIKNSIDLNQKINLNDYTYNDMFNCLSLLLNRLPEESSMTYLNIITEELSFILNNKLGCPTNKLEIILVNLVPFIEYPFTISIDWIISLELKFLIIKLIKKNKINSLDIKKELINQLWDKYIKTNIIQEDYLGCLISQWISKIKV